MTVLAFAVASLAVSLASLAVSRAAYLRAKAVTRVVQSFTTPSGVVTFDGPLSSEDFRRFREAYETRAAAEPLTDVRLADLAKRWRTAWATEPRRPL